MEPESSPGTNKPIYRKHFIPLESNPELFTELIHELGVLPALCFQDVLSLDEPELLAFIPRPALALILVFPTSDSYEKRKAVEEAMRNEYQGSDDRENVVWFKQTINNACGLYASNSTLSKLLEESLPLQPDARAKILEDSEEIESAYTRAARQGDSEVSENPEDEVNFHYVCFVRSPENGHIYELDGDRKGPIDRGEFEGGDDMVSEGCLNLVRDFVTEEEGNLNFSLMALVSIE